jgi:hypothetical protein
MRFEFRGLQAQTAQTYTHIRLYRQNITLLTPMVLVQEIPVSSGGPTVFVIDPLGGPQTMIDHAEAQVSGPFKPVKNGVPTDVYLGIPYRGRAYYASLGSTDGAANSSRLYHSSIDSPEHVDEADFLFLPDESGGSITGLAEMNGQLAIGKERSAWILSGQVEAVTNSQIASGLPGLDSQHDLRRTKVAVGPANKYGANGFVVAGAPSLVYYAAEEGLFVFDGMQERMLTDAIRNTWKLFAGPVPSDMQVSFATDSYYELLLMLNARTGVLLVYHYGIRRPDGIGAFAVWLLDDPPWDGSMVLSSPRITAIGNTQNDYEVMRLAAVPRPDSVQLRGHTYTCRRGPGSGFVVGYCPGMEYESPPMVPTPGRETHVYSAKYHLEPGQTSCFIDATLQFNNGLRPVTQHRVHSGDRPFALKSVQRSATQVGVKLSVPNPSGFLWKSGFALTGWELDAEPVGQR